MQAQDPADPERIRHFQRLRAQIMELVATSAGQRRALDRLAAKAHALAERIERAGLAPRLKSSMQR